MPSKPGDVFEKISNGYYQLTGAEKKVADYVVIHQSDAQYMSISDLADACGVAEATISRFCRRLNYKGYNAFKLALANSTAARAGFSLVGGEVEPDDTIPDMCQKVFHIEVDAMAQTLDLIRPENIAAAAEILWSADKVLCMGQGGSMIMAMEAAHLFSTVYSNYIPVYDSHLQTMAVTHLTPRDAILFFSYSGSTRELIELLSLARERRARVILITRFPNAPAAVYADVILQCGAKEGPMQIGSVSARVAQLFLVDVLFSEISRRDMENCKATRERVAAALAEKHV